MLSARSFPELYVVESESPSRRLSRWCSGLHGISAPDWFQNSVPHAPRPERKGTGKLVAEKDGGGPVSRKYPAGTAAGPHVVA